MPLTHLPTQHPSPHIQPAQRTEPIVAACGHNGASTLRHADLLVRQHVMNTCALPKHLDRGRVTEHFRTNPASLQESEDQLQILFRSRQADDGNAQEKKDSSSWLFRRRDWTGLHGVWLAQESAQAAPSAPKTSRSAPDRGQFGLIGALRHTQKLRPHHSANQSSRSTVGFGNLKHSGCDEEGHAMANEALPAELESLSHSARVRRAVELGRQARTDSQAAQVLREWRAGGFTLRLLSAFACHGSRDSLALAELAGDESRTVARVAISVLCDVGDDETLLAVLRTLPSRRAAKLLFWLRRRPKVVDRFVTERADEGDMNAWPLVPFGSASVLDRYFATAAECGGVVFWRRLAVIHPARAVTETVARLDAATNPDGLLFAYARAVIAALSSRAPESALAVVNALRRHQPLAAIPLQVLASRRPVAVADLVLGSNEIAAVYFERIVHRLDVARIVALYRRASHYMGAPDRWLARLPAADRVAIYRELGPAWTGANG